MRGASPGPAQDRGAPVTGRGCSARKRLRQSSGKFPVGQLSGPIGQPFQFIRCIVGWLESFLFGAMEQVELRTLYRANR